MSGHIWKTKKPEVPLDILRLTMEDAPEAEDNGDAQKSNVFLKNLRKDVTHKLTDMHVSGRVKKGTTVHRMSQHLAGQDNRRKKKNAMQDLHHVEDLDKMLMEDLETTLELFIDEIRHRPRRARRNRRLNNPEGEETLDMGAVDDTLAGKMIGDVGNLTLGGAKATLAVSKYAAAGAVNVAVKSVGLQAGQSGAPSDDDDKTEKTDKNKHRISADHLVMGNAELTHHSSQKDNLEKSTSVRSMQSGHRSVIPGAKRTQITHWVALMMNPTLFTRGVRLETLHMGMMRVLMMRRSDVSLMLDKFEEEWVKNNIQRSKVIKKYANLSKEKIVQCDMEAPKPELNINDIEDAVCEELKLGRFANPKAPDELKQAKAAYNWARFSTMMGHTFSLFNTKDLIRLIRRKKEKRYEYADNEIRRHRESLASLQAYWDQVNPNKAIEAAPQANSEGNAATNPSTDPPLPPPEGNPEETAW
jgi:hypothetical protein